MINRMQIVPSEAAYHLWRTTRDKLLIISYRNSCNAASFVSDYQLAAAKTQLSQDVLITIIEGEGHASGGLGYHFCDTFFDQGPGIYVFANKMHVATFPSDVVAMAITMQTQELVDQINMLRSNLD